MTSMMILLGHLQTIVPAGSSLLKKRLNLLLGGIVPEIFSLKIVMKRGLIVLKLFLEELKLYKRLILLLEKQQVKMEALNGGAS